SASNLPAILDRAGVLPTRHAVDHEPLEPGRIYVAPADHHLLVTRTEVRVVRGPHENLHRPAIDPLFRSAALAFGPAAIAVVLTGTMDDGAAGVGAIAARGGTVLVQGTLGEWPDPAMLRFRCRAGHAFGAESLLPAQAQRLDGALWTALRALEERSSLARRMAGRLRDTGHDSRAQRFDGSAEEADERA